MGRDLADSETERGGGVRRGATRGAGRVGPREGSFQRLRRPAAQPALRGAVNRDLGSPGLAGTGAGGDRSGAGAADVAGSRLTPHPHPSTWGGGAPRFLLQPAAAKRDRPRLVFNCCHHLPDLQEGPPAAAGALEHLPTRLPAPPPGCRPPLPAGMSHRGSDVENPRTWGHGPGKPASKFIYSAALSPRHRARYLPWRPGVAAVFVMITGAGARRPRGAPPRLRLPAVSLPSLTCKTRIPKRGAPEADPRRCKSSQGRVCSCVPS